MKGARMNETELKLIKLVISLLEENNNYTNKTEEALNILRCFEVQ
jgi:hypothetical protein